MYFNVTTKYKKKCDETILSLQKAQDILLNILYSFQNFCDDNQINMSLAYGSLLGAAREKNIIRWDDDVDVMMSQKDFDLLKQNLSKLKSYNLDYYHYSSAKNTHTNEIRIFLQGYYRIINGNNGCYLMPLCVDVFPMCKIPIDKNGLPNSRIDRKLKKISKLKKILYFKESKTKSKNRLIGFLKTSIQFFTKIIPSRHIHIKIDQLIESLYNGEAEYALFSPYAGYHFKYFYERSLLQNKELIMFGKKEVYITSKYDYYLTKTYGDWKTPKDPSNGSNYSELFLKR